MPPLAQAIGHNYEQISHISHLDIQYSYMVYVRTVQITHNLNGPCMHTHVTHVWSNPHIHVHVGILNTVASYVLATYTWPFSFLK